jgi:hypothetical protein
VSAYLDELAGREEHAARKPRRKATPVLARSLAVLRREGYLVAIVERFNRFARVRQDCFGLFDALAIKADRPGVLGIQATTAEGSHMSAHRAKLQASPALAVWLAAGNRVELMGWAKRGGRGQRKTWKVYREEVTGAVAQP